MADFIAIIHFTEAFDKAPDIEKIEADTLNDAWHKLIKGRWGDYDPRMGGLEDPRTAVKNGDWDPVDRVEMFHVVLSDEGAYFDIWYEKACEAYERQEAMKTEEGERAYYEKLKKKYG